MFGWLQLLSPVVLLDMLASLPCIEGLWVQFDDIVPWESIRREQYESLVATIPQWPASITTLDLSYYQEDPSNQRPEPAGFAHSDKNTAGSDRFGRVVRRFSKQLTS